VLIAHYGAFGESANELVTKWGKGPYRYGFPDFYAAEFPVHAARYDQSRIYSGVIGKHYPDAETSRYHYMYDPNMYMQPGFGAAGMSAEDAIAVFERFLGMVTTFHSFDVVFDVGTSTGAYSDFNNRLWVVHGGTMALLQQATAAAGGTVAAQVPNSDVTARINNARMMDPTIAIATLGTLDDVKAAIENMITALKSGDVTPVAPRPIAISKPPMSRKTKIVIAAATGSAVVLGLVTAVLLKRH
jgi:hypothetical protein